LGALNALNGKQKKNFGGGGGVIKGESNQKPRWEAFWKKKRSSTITKTSKGRGSFARRTLK